jgi:hypothetical protein
MEANSQLLSFDKPLEYSLFISIEVKSWLYYAKEFSRLVLRVGSSFWLGLAFGSTQLSTQVLSFTSKKCCHVRYPCHTWDLRPSMKWYVPTSMLSMAEMAWIDLKWTGTYDLRPMWTGPKVALKLKEYGIWLVAIDFPRFKNNSILNTPPTIHSASSFNQHCAFRKAVGLTNVLTNVDTTRVNFFHKVSIICWTRQHPTVIESANDNPKCPSFDNHEKTFLIFFLVLHLGDNSLSRLREAPKSLPNFDFTWPLKLDKHGNSYLHRFSLDITQRSTFVLWVFKT